MNALKDLTEAEILNTLKPTSFKIFKALQTHYVSPLAKVNTDIESLKRKLLTVMPVLRIEDPQSWLRVLQANISKPISALTAFTRVNLLMKYFDNSNGMSVFENDYHAKKGISVPYFEWTTHQNYQAITDYLGQNLGIFFLQTHLKNEILNLIKILLAEESKQQDQIDQDQTPQDQITTALALPKQSAQMPSLNYHYILICESSLFAEAQALLETLDQSGHRLTIIEDTLQYGNYSIAGKFETHYHPEKALLSVFKSATPLCYVVNATGQLVNDFTKNDLHKIVDELQKINEN